MSTSGGSSSSKAKKKTSGARTKYEKSLMTKQPEKKQKDTRKMTGLKDPCVLSMDRQRAADMDVDVAITNESTVGLKRKADHAPCTQLLPLRAHQTLGTLSIHAGRSHVAAENDADTVLDSETDLHRELIKTNEQLYRQRNHTTFPLDALVNLGMLSSQTPTVDARQNALSVQFTQSEQFMRDQLLQITRLPISSSDAQSEAMTNNSNSRSLVLTREVNKKRRVGGGEEGETPIASTVKMGHIFGPLNFKCSYARRASNEYKKFIYPIYDRDKERITREFFLDDALEDDVPAGSLPCRFKLFQSLLAANQRKYQQHEAVMRDASANQARSSLEAVNRCEIRKYRYRPRPGDALCFNGTRCYFYTYCSDPDVRYVGRVFRTPGQLELLKNGGTLPQRTENLLCIDCILAAWTKKNAENTNKDRAPSLPFNHFTVMVGKGEYSADCMLAAMSNGLVTGFVGHVPRYDPKHRAKEDVTLRHLGEGAAVTESYIAEIGMDF